MCVCVTNISCLNYAIFIEISSIVCCQAMRLFLVPNCRCPKNPRMILFPPHPPFLCHPAHCMFLPWFFPAFPNRDCDCKAVESGLWFLVSGFGTLDSGQRTVSGKQCNMSLLPVPGNSVGDIVVAGPWFIGAAGGEGDPGEVFPPIPRHTLLIADCGSWKFVSVSRTSPHRTQLIHIWTETPHSPVCVLWWAFRCELFV